MRKIALCLHHRLNPGPETVAGLRHGVLVEVAHHLLDPNHQEGYNVVMGFIDMTCNPKVFLFLQYLPHSVFYDPAGCR